MRFVRSSLLVVGGLLSAACVRGRTAPATPLPSPATVSRTGAASSAPGSAPSTGAPAAPSPSATQAASTPFTPGEPTPRPYASVIPARAKSRSGIFDVHQVGTRLYFEIPARELGRDYLITTVLAGTPTGIPVLGTWLPGTDQVVRFERRDNRIVMRRANFDNIASDTAMITGRSMGLIEFSPIMAVFNVEAWGKDSASVIDVTRMFTGGISEFTAFGRRATIDAARTFIDRFNTYSRNVNVTAQQSFTLAPVALPPGFPGATAGPPQPTTEAYTFSIVRLPDVPMMPRLSDRRVGYFSTNKTDFGLREQRVAGRAFISRWRLECAGGRTAGLCDPKRPITYYVDPATPAWLIPWVKRGIEEWQPAFEEAGFRRAIVAADAPSDPDFSGEDASVSMVRWLPSAIANAVGPRTVDPRSGEILDADVQMYHNIMELQRDWYFAQVGHLDTRAQRLPFPDTLMGRLVQFVVAHEVGHTLGLPHNYKGSSMYPMDSIRSRSWVARMGHSPSIMDYARFNYVAQPEDGIALADLVPRVGVYDRYAVRWGYTPIPGARTPDEERPTLETWTREQDATPWLRFAGPEGEDGADPGEESEAVGDADAVRATRLGFKNLARIMKLVESATSADVTASNDVLRDVYRAVVQQWSTEAFHVARVIGGLDKQEKSRGQPGPVFTPVSRARQQEAMRFLVDEVFATPRYLIEPAIIRRTQTEGAIALISNAQVRSLNEVLWPVRLQRMIEMEALAGRASDVYRLGDMLTDLRRGLWREVATGAAIDAYRRRLQLQYLEIFRARINPYGPVAPPTQSREQIALLRDEMRLLDGELASGVRRTTDRTSRAHLLYVRDQIAAMLAAKE